MGREGNAARCLPSTPSKEGWVRAAACRGEPRPCPRRREGTAPASGDVRWGELVLVFREGSRQELDAVGEELQAHAEPDRLATNCAPASARVVTSSPRAEGGTAGVRRLMVVAARRDHQKISTVATPALAFPSSSAGAGAGRQCAHEGARPELGRSAVPGLQVDRGDASRVESS